MFLALIVHTLRAPHRRDHAMNENADRRVRAQRERFATELGDALHCAETDTGLLAVLALRIDRYAEYCSTFGPDVGQSLLAAIAERIGTTIETNDIVVPCGTTLFVVLHAIAQDAVVPRAARILEAIAQPLLLTNLPTLRPVANGGLSIYPCDGRSASALIDCACAALVRAEQSGPNALER